MIPVPPFGRGEEMKSRHTGMTLIEILVVTAIIAVLVAIAVPAVMSARRSGGRATCLMNLRQIGMALIAYRQDTGVYPEPGKAIGALAEGYPRLLAKIPTCPRDPEDNNNTYGELYNYWGYAPKTSPASLGNPADADSVYNVIQEQFIIPTSGLKWIKSTNFLAGDVIQIEGVYYWCLQDHLSDDDTDADNNGVPDLNEDGNPANDLDNKPLVGLHWKEYWRSIPGAYIWQNGYPDSDFPGLANPNAPSNTIVTICPQHVNDINNYLVLRVSGETESVPQQKTDKEFWTLSK
jgi:prepilin-type N-terminal cleavage/methylation domain-containing protein